MSKGAVYKVNQATVRPILIAGVEKRLSLLNALLAFPLIASTHFHLPEAFIGVAFFVIAQFLLRLVSKEDPMLGTLFKRSTRYSVNSYFPAIGHAHKLETSQIKSVSRPW